MEIEDITISIFFSTKASIRSSQATSTKLTGRPNSRPSARAKSGSTPTMFLPSLKTIGGETGATPTRKAGAPAVSRSAENKFAPAAAKTSVAAHRTLARVGFMRMCLI